jgi:hypothetical protein
MDWYKPTAINRRPSVMGCLDLSRSGTSKYLAFTGTSAPVDGKDLQIVSPESDDIGLKYL